MKVTIEKREDGSYIAYNTEGDSCTIIGTGSTLAEAKKDFMNTMEEVKDTYVEDGQDIPAELVETPEFKFDISSLFEYYSAINVSAFARRIGINPSLMRRYKNGQAAISDTQIERIENGIHELGQELTNLRLI